MAAERAQQRLEQRHDRGERRVRVRADPARVPAENLLGPEEIAWPWFVVLGAAVSLGLMEGALEAALRHLGGADPRTRADLARIRLRTDAVRVLHYDALARHPERATHRLNLLAVTDLAMKVCGDAAFRRDLGIERRFRDARAAAAIEPTVDTVLETADVHDCA